MIIKSSFEPVIATFAPMSRTILAHTAPTRSDLFIIIVDWNYPVRYFVNQSLVMALWTFWKCFSIHTIIRINSIISLDCLI